MQELKENTPPGSRSLNYFHLQLLKKENGAELLQLTEKLQQVNRCLDYQIAEEKQVRNEVLELVPYVMKKYLDTRFDRLKNAKLEFAQKSDNKRNSEAELERAKENLRQLKEKAAEEAEEQKRELAEAKRAETELQQRVNRKLAILKALEEM